MVHNLYCWPSDPGERLLVTRPIVAVTLALPIEPFIDQLRNLSAEAMAHGAVVRDGVVVEVPFKFQFGLLQEFALLSAASLSLQPSFHLF